MPEFSRSNVLRAMRIFAISLLEIQKGAFRRVQVPNNHILTLNLYYSYYYPIPKYLIIGYLGP